MRHNVFSRFQHIMDNLSRPGCKLIAEVYNPQKQETAFEEPVRLCRIPRGAVAKSGDHVLHEGHHYLLGAHSEDIYSLNFRLIPLPDQLLWGVQPTLTKDLVTGLEKPTGPALKSNIWGRKITTGYGKDVKNTEREIIKFICGETIQVGDTLDGLKIRRVYLEQGIQVSET